MSAHPLDPLTSDEVRQSVAILRRDHGVSDTWRFASIELVEPTKDDLRAHAEGTHADRRARLVCWNREDGAVYSSRVSLTRDLVLDWKAEEDGQPNLTVDEVHDCDAAMRREPRVIEGLARRGITDLDNVSIEAWAYGAHLLPEPWTDRRIAWCDTWVRSEPGANFYARPVSGFHPIVDLNTLELLDLEDDGSGPGPQTMGEYVPRLVPGLELRDDIKAIDITQPEGTSLRLDGNLLTWQKWSLRIGFNFREGMVLHTVGYEDDGRVRPIAHRMSFAEMIVPYRDPATDHYRRTAFDIGEWGLGFMTTSLELGCDCLGDITYLDAILHDSAGEPYTIKNAICIHEEDDGVLWKHVDDTAGAETRRSRRLVVSFHATVGNYEYLVYWRFYQDGNIQVEVRATGIMVTTPLPSGHPAGQQPPSGTLVDNRTYAPFHQHFIVARLDMDVDGETNTVYATESAPIPIGPDNPHGVALGIKKTALQTESDGRQDFDWATQRSWTVVNDAVSNRLGTPVGYKLVPEASFPTLLDPASPILERAAVIGHTLWVTPYAPDERWPCGDFVVQSREDRGLPVWTAQDRPIQDADVVLWYTFGIHHIPRPEEWPIMSVDVVSFWLKPVGFFDRNPALDVPPSPHGHHGECHTA
jgi:primary-amine oxidase